MELSITDWAREILSRLRESRTWTLPIWHAYRCFLERVDALLYGHCTFYDAQTSSSFDLTTSRSLIRVGVNRIGLHFLDPEMPQPMFTIELDHISTLRREFHIIRIQSKLRDLPIELEMEEAAAFERSVKKYKRSTQAHRCKSFSFSFLR